MAPIPALEHINPDAMAPADLARVARELRRLAHYCEAKGTAMRERADGDVATALAVEDFAEKIYKKLPPEWRW
jgi:hypothetical protein